MVLALLAGVNHGVPAVLALALAPVPPVPALALALLIVITVTVPLQQQKRHYYKKQRFLDFLHVKNPLFV